MSTDNVLFVVAPGKASAVAGEVAWTLSLCGADPPTIHPYCEIAALVRNKANAMGIAVIRRSGQPYGFCRSLIVNG